MPHVLTVHQESVLSRVVAYLASAQLCVLNAVVSRKRFFRRRRLQVS